MSHVRLGARERQVLTRIEAGMQRWAIAADLGISPLFVSVCATRARKKGYRVPYFESPRGPVATTLERARPLVMAGLGCAELGRRLGVSKQRGYQLRKAILEGKRDYRHA